MTTLEQCLARQNKEGILTYPTIQPKTLQTSTGKVSATVTDSAFPSTLNIDVVNNTTSNDVWVTITGMDLVQQKLFILQADGTTPYYPDDVSAPQTGISTDIFVPLGNSGSTKTLTIPQLQGGRIWFSQDEKLTFQLNPGPALAEPTVMNPSDASAAIRWDFAELTFGPTEVYANLSYVDFVSVPTALKLTTTDGSATLTAEGLPSDGIDNVCKALQDQASSECKDWDKLVVQLDDGNGNVSFLRALSPNTGISIDSSLFSGYYDDYVNQVWSQYTNNQLSIDTQAQWGTVTGQVDGSGNMQWSGYESMAKPTTADIFSCSTGSFAGYTNNADVMGNIGARVAAGFNRSVILDQASQPDGSSPSDYYKKNPTNHYSRILHENNLDNRGYAFPYDDVVPSGGVDQSGSVVSSAPDVLTLYIGGGGTGSSSTTTTRSTHTRTSNIMLREMARPGKQLVGSRGNVRRSVPQWNEKRAVGGPFYSLHAAAPAEAMMDYAPSSRPLDAEKAHLMDLEAGNASPYWETDAAQIPRTQNRLQIVLQQLLRSLWLAILAAGRGVWACVPRRLRAPLAAWGVQMAASPAVAAASGSIAAFATATSTAVTGVVAAFAVRPIVTRVLVGFAVFATYLFLGEPAVAQLLAGLMGQQAGQPLGGAGVDAAAAMPMAADNSTVFVVQA